jgi:predicted RecB family nuclease
MEPNSQLFEAYLKCPTKCWRRSRGETGEGNAYAEWVRAQNESYRAEGVRRLQDTVPEGERIVAPATENLKAAKWRLAVDLVAQASAPTGSGSVSLPERTPGGTPGQPADGTSALRPQPNPWMLESRLHAIERVASEGRGKPAQFIPIRFIFRNKLTRDDRLLVAFDALVLSGLLGRDVNLGEIIHGDDRGTLKIKTAGLLGQVRKLAVKMAGVVTSASPPDLILSRHCGECEFQDRCRQKAVEKDDLSLLATMTEKERKKFHNKGIFTVTQLSHIFRPRRPRKRGAIRHEKYHPALKALAIRERKIHIVGTPELKLEGTPVYLDVEGLPEREFYYLIGAGIEGATGFEQHSFWADGAEDEKTIWADFLRLLANVQNPVLVHYGHFETVFLKEMCARYGDPPQHLTQVARALEQPFNLLSFMFARIYFPTYSNGLKDIGAFIGATWQTPGASGAQSLVWRYQWEETRDDDLKQTLLAYNRDDCQAACLLASELKQIGKMAASRTNVDFAYSPKENTTERGAVIHGTLKAILASAYTNYERNRIKVRRKQENQPEPVTQKKRVSPIRARNLPTRHGRRVRVASKRKCDVHRGQVLKPGDETVEHTIVDLVFTKNGCRKVLTTYVGKLAYCPLCGSAHLPPTIQRLGQQIFGHGFMAWIAYQRVVLRLPIGVISMAAQDLFSEELNSSSVTWLISRVADDYEATENLLWQQVLRSRVLHVDETKLNIRGSIHYVWVFTDGTHVVFRLTPTRETDFLKELLANYHGTLISDFYGGYDALACRQQKCLVHLIRDLNDDLWKNPFNAEYEGFVASVRDLLVPILEDVARFGLKAWHLRKHQKSVERFYRQTINGPAPKCDITTTYHKRFVRYRDSLFRFLDHDGVPWHNNVAECAIRHLAVQRKISGYFHSSGAKQYLRLLGIAQTCRF